MVLWDRFTKQKSQEIIAIDVGSASISAALARVGPRATEIVSVIRHPFDLIQNENDTQNQKRSLHVVKSALAAVFADAHQQMPHAQTLRISFAEPFFQEREVEKAIERPQEQKSIAQSEIDALTHDNRQADHALVSVAQSLLNFRINGYPVAKALGYPGHILQVRIQEIAVSRPIYDDIVELKSRWYPKSDVAYFADPQVLRAALHASAFKKMPALLIDVGGEVTGFYLTKEGETPLQYPPVFIGLKTLERRIASTLRLDQAHAAALVRHFGSESLDEPLKKRIDPIIENLLKDWWESSKNALGARGLGDIAQILVSGSGRDFPPLMHYINQHANNVFSGVQTPSIDGFVFPSESLLPPKSLSRGGDIMLASLILYVS